MRSKLKNFLDFAKENWGVVIAYIVIIFTFCLMFNYSVFNAIKLRKAHIERFDTAMELYNEKRYEEALPLFATLIDWGNAFTGGRDGEEMYDKTLAKVRDIEIIEYCPECHQMVSISYVPLEERS